MECVKTAPAGKKEYTKLYKHWEAVHGPDSDGFKERNRENKARRKKKEEEEEEKKDP